MKKLNIKVLSCLLYLAVAAAFASCDRSVFYADEQSVDAEGWHARDEVLFDVDVPDTATYYDFMLDIRNTNDYAYSNFFVFINTTFPDGTIAHDTMELPLAEVDGRWLGQTHGKYVSNRYYFRRNVRFNQAGHYRFAVSHAMRDEDLKGIADVGFCIRYAGAEAAEEEQQQQ